MYGGDSKDPSKRGTFGNTLLYSGILTEKDRNLLAVRGTGVNRYHFLVQGLGLMLLGFGVWSVELRV